MDSYFFDIIKRFNYKPNLSNLKLTKDEAKQVNGSMQKKENKNTEYEYQARLSYSGWSSVSNFSKQTNTGLSSFEVWASQQLFQFRLELSWLFFLNINWEHSKNKKGSDEGFFQIHWELLFFDFLNVYKAKSKIFGFKGERTNRKWMEQ